jgi:hypothetical protein
VPGSASSPDRAWGKFVAGGDCTRGVATRCVSLDDFVRDAPAPDGIKCDVEGAEIEALQGSEKLLHTHHPWIVCETHSAKNNIKVRELLARLEYEVDTIDEMHLLGFTTGSRKSSPSSRNEM